MLKSINPTTQEIIKTYPEASSTEINQILQKAQKAFLEWRKTDFSARRECLVKLAGLLEEEAETYARLMAVEMGKPISSGLAEIKKCAWTCRFFSQQAEKFLQPELISTEAQKSYVTFNPLGIILAIMPWNFPFWQVIRFAAPTLMAGNVGLLKHASNVSGCALALEDLFHRSGFPPNVFTTLLVESSRLKGIMENPLISAVTLTGSVAAGKSVAGICGSLLKKTVMELGGNDPFIVLKDACLPLAAKAAVQGRLINSGQSCIAAKRFIVVKEVQKEFEILCLENLLKASHRMGDPLDPLTEVGPLASLALREELHRQVTASLAKGAKCLLGGGWPVDLPGAFYTPTLLTEVRPGMPVYHEETFGPVASLIVVEDENEAIRVANDSLFGLGATVYSQNLAKAEKWASEELEAGLCFVNDIVKSDPRLPFGGIKQSGYGRELSSYGIREFMNIKTVWIAP